MKGIVVVVVEPRVGRRSEEVFLIDAWKLFEIFDC